MLKFYKVISGFHVFEEKTKQGFSIYYAKVVDEQASKRQSDQAKRKITAYKTVATRHSLADILDFCNASE